MPNLLPIAYLLAIVLGLIAIIDLGRLGILPFSGPLAACFVVGVTVVACLWVIFNRDGRRGWAAVIPIYNWFVLCQMAGYVGQFPWLIFVPGANIVAFYLVCVGLAEYFKRSKRFGICLFLLFPIFLPVLAFSNKIQHEYHVQETIPIKDNLPSVREYAERKAVRERFASAVELEKNGELEKAIEMYTETISIDSKHTESYFKRGKLLMNSGAKAAAIADFKRVIELADNPELADLAKENIAKLDK